MGEAEVGAFLSHLAVDKRVAASTQNQALSTLLFLYKEVLKKPLDWIEGIQRAKRPSRLPVVFTKEEFQSILRNLEGTKWQESKLSPTRRSSLENRRPDVTRIKVDYSGCDQFAQGASLIAGPIESSSPPYDFGWGGVSFLRVSPDFLSLLRV